MTDIQPGRGFVESIIAVSWASTIAIHARWRCPQKGYPRFDLPDELFPWPASLRYRFFILFAPAGKQRLMRIRPRATSSCTVISPGVVAFCATDQSGVQLLYWRNVECARHQPDMPVSRRHQAA